MLNVFKFDSIILEQVYYITLTSSKMSIRHIAIVLFVSLPLDVYSFKHFQDRIPNGESVPHPCKPNYIWRGVGHKNHLGGGDRNPFGVDFAKYGHTWTQELCQMDSDDDGRTNGEELGDPRCVWNEGEAPDVIVGLSHPGLCEPYDNDECKKKNTWVTCDTTEFRCDALDREDPNDLRNITIQFPRTKVPSAETSYYCMTFDLPEDKDLHMIATEPLIDNAYVMHHIILFGCEPSAELMTSPSPCDMKVRYCENIIGIWTVGFQGECFNPEAGFLIGKSPKAYKRVAMQFHWNNPLKENDYYDGSGMILHLTQNKRINNAGVFVVGQNYLQLTPGEEKIEVVGTCTNEMSKMRLVGPLHITRVFNHMHYLGRQMRIEHYRDGVKLRDLSFDEVYSYDSPVFHVHREAIEFQRGDEIRTTCTYKTKERKKTVFHGDATSDEMCYGFLTFYPAENARSAWCVEWRDTDPFSYYTENVIKNCPFRDFMNMTHPDTQRLHTRVLSHCSHLGLCLKECISVVRELRANHPCLQGDIHEYLRERARNGGIETIQLALFFSSIDSCNTEIAKMDCPVINSTPDPTSASHIAKFSPHLIFLGALHFINLF